MREYTLILALPGDDPPTLEVLVEGLVQQLHTTNPHKPSQISHQKNR